MLSSYCKNLFFGSFSPKNGVQDEYILQFIGTSVLAKCACEAPAFQARLQRCTQWNWQLGDASLLLQNKVGHVHGYKDPERLLVLSAPVILLTLKREQEKVCMTRADELKPPCYR